MGGGDGRCRIARCLKTVGTQAEEVRGVVLQVCYKPGKAVGPCHSLLSTGGVGYIAGLCRIPALPPLRYMGNHKHAVVCGQKVVDERHCLQRYAVEVYLGGGVARSTEGYIVTGVGIVGKGHCVLLETAAGIGKSRDRREG